MRHATLAITLTAPLVLATCSGSAPPALSLTLSQPRAPADGISQIRATVHATGLAPTSVVSFELAGPGLLSSTQVRVQDGQAEVDLYAPFEEELTAAVASATLSARAVALPEPVVASAAVDFTIPTGGAPVLRVRATPDRVRAGGAQPITLVVEGRRLTDATVALAVDNPAIVLPQTVTLEADGALLHGQLELPTPAEPTTVTVTVTGGGAPPASVTLRYTGEGEADYDVTGTFAQISYSVVEIGGLVFLDPDPQCVVAPSLSLVRVEQQGDQVTSTFELCDIQMPSVNVVLIGESRTWVDPSFVAAMNETDGAPLTMSIELDGSFAPDVASLPPSQLGVELANDSDAMPTSGDDPRVRDADGDGHPGVTVHNSTQGDQYTATRTRMRTMTGQVVGSDAIDGAQTATTESAIFNGGSGGLSPVITPKSSPFHMRRVDGRNGAPNIAPRDGDSSGVSCADVRAYAAELQAAAPGPDPAHACDGGAP